MTEHMCDRCGRRYNHREYMELDRVPVDPDDPERRQGYHKVCKCGAEFWADCWTTRDTIEVEGEEFTVSTVFLTLAHGPDGDQWYETLVRPGDWMDRYTTQEQAEAGHEAVCERLRNGEWHFETTGRRLVLRDQ